MEMNNAISPPPIDPSLAQKTCVLIPAYREEVQLVPVIKAVRALLPHIVVIDDGSDDRTADLAEACGVKVLRHAVNQGKGAALLTGFTYALEQGFEVVITMDADGQHAVTDLPRFLETYQRTGLSVLIGNRMGNTSNMPWVRRWTNRFMSWMISRRLGCVVPDTQCGYRLLDKKVLPLLKVETTRFDAETEMLLILASHGVKIGSVPVATIYHDEISKIRPCRDTLRFFRMMAKFNRMYPS